LGLDHIAQIIHTASPETVVGGIVDAGYFPAYKSSRKNYDFNMRQSFNFLNMSAGADIKCTAVADVLSDCAFASNLIPRIHTPHFLMQSRFDKWQIVNELGLGADSTDIVNMYGNFVMTSIFKTVEKNSKATLFLDSCTHHVVIPNTNLASTIIDGKGVAVTDSLRVWMWKLGRYHSYSTDFPQIRSQIFVYPCSDCCFNKSIAFTTNS